MAAIGVIINPHAGSRRRANDRKARLAAVVGRQGDFECVVETANLEELRQALAEFHRQRVEVLAICGGDGSVCRAVSLAVEIWGAQALPVILPLHGGTMNNIARSVGVPRSSEAALAALVQHKQSLQLTARNVLKINDEIYGCLVGSGLVSSFLELYYEGPKPGPLGAAWLLLRLVASTVTRGALIRRVVAGRPGRATLDGQALPATEFTVILASCVESIGLGVRPFSRAGERPGYFHVLAGDPTAAQLVARLPRFWRGFPPQLDPLYDGTARSLEIQFETAQRFTVDGELFDATTRLQIESGPRVEFVSGVAAS